MRELIATDGANSSLRHALEERGGGRGRRPAHGAPLEVERDVEVHVAHVGRAVGGVVRLVAG